MPENEKEARNKRCARIAHNFVLCARRYVKEARPISPKHEAQIDELIEGMEALMDKLADQAGMTRIHDGREQHGGD